MKRLFALILALMMIFALSACGDESDTAGSSPSEKTPGSTGTSGGEEAPAEVNSVLSRAIDAIDNIDSFKIKVENSADFNINGMVTRVSATGTGEHDVRGGKAFVDMNAKSGPLEMNTKGYIETDGSVATVYAGINGMWIRQSVPVASLDTYGMGYRGVEELRFYLESFETDEMTTDGGNYIIKGHILPEKTIQVISGMGAGDQLTASGITGELINSMLDDLKKVKITFTVEASTYFVKKIEIDAVDALNSMYENIGNIASSPVSMRVENNTAYVEYYDYNVPVNIVIPDEAKAA